MTDPSNVVTTDFVTSLNAALKRIEPFLNTLNTKSAQADYFQHAHTELTKQHQALAGRVERLKPGIGRVSRKDPGVTKLIEEITALGKRADQESKRQVTYTYLFGPKKVGNESAMRSEIKSTNLPKAGEGYISQAVNDLYGGRGKATTGVGAGILHASAGKSNVKDNSCSLFFTRTSKNNGLEEEIRVLAVGAHATSNTYTIYKSFDSRFKEGKVVSISS